MAKDLTLLANTPQWLEELCREIDSLKFTSAFDLFATGAVLAFGVTQIVGAKAMQAFFIKIDAPLDIEHRILEVWSGETTTFVRGEAEMAKKSMPEIRVQAPFMWLFKCGDGGGLMTHWFVTAGPLATDKVL